MKKLLILLGLFGGACFAQGAVTVGTSCAASMKPPATLNCSVTLAGSATATNGPVADVQWTLTTSQAVGVPSATAGAVSVAAAKTASSSGNTTIISGFNATPISDGILANLSIPIPPGVTCPGNSPCFTVGLTLAVASNGAGSAIQVTVNPPSSVSVSDNCDVNGDGLDNQADYTAELNGALAPAPGTMDRNGDGVTNVLDVQIVANAGRGLGCTATK